MIVRVLLTALCILAIPGLASAQSVCSEGRVTIEGSGESCCWPGQTWTEAHCAGAPTCPNGLIAAGEDCTAAPIGARDAIGGAYFEEPIRRSRNQFVEALHQSGVPTLFAIGYGPALMLGFAGLIPGTTAAPYVYNFIPLVGPLLSVNGCSAATETCATGWYWFYAIGDTIIQFAGAVLILGAMLTQPVARTESTGTSTASNRRIRWGISPGAGSTPLGATLGIVTF